MGKFVIQKTATGYKFDLKAANGETVAVSEVYSARAACVKGVRSVASCAPGAPLADLTGGVGELPANPRFEMFLDKSGGYRFRLRSRNGKVLVASQGYGTKAACENGIESVRKNALSNTEEER